MNTFCCRALELFGRARANAALLGCFRLSRNLLLPLAAAVLSANAADPVLLWQIGKPDNDNREFALAPNRYAEFREDGFFVVGRSEAKRDWPYAHPGPDDSWAGGRPHTFNIVFGLKAPPQPGDCRLLVDLNDTQSRQAPRLRIEINGKAFDRQMPAGAGDDSIYGQPARGKEHKFEVVFPSALLRAGANEIGITTVSGCWVLYDWLGLETPPGAELADAQGTVVSSLRSPPVLVDRGGRLYQTIELALRHLGEEASARVRVDGREATNLTLRATTHTVEIPVPPVDKETSVSIEVEVGGKTLAQRTVQLKPVRKWVVYLLPHSHVDIGYTHVQTDVERAQWKYLEMGIETARRSANNPPGSRFKWNVEVLWAVDSYLRQATPEKREQFIQAVKAGQVGLQALYGNELTGLCRPEELLRLLDCAQRVAKLCDTPIQSAMITDVPGYTWGMVPAFAHSGVKYFSIGPNGGDRIGHTIAAWGDKPFWWIGPNGRDKVLVWMTGTGYYQVFHSQQKLQDYLAQLEAKGYPYDFVQVRHCLGDNGAPDVNFPEKVKAWNETHAYPKLVIATSEEMFKDFEQRYGDQIPQAKGDFTPYWEDGAASSARETALNRASAERLTQAETLFAMLNPKAYPAEEFYQAWRNVILYDEHTWGAHNSISQPDHPFVKSQWAIKQAFALDGDKQSRKLIESALASRGGEPVSGDSEVTAVDVFNTTPNSIPHALVVIPKELVREGDGVYYSPTNQSPINFQRLTSGELVFRACWAPYGGNRYYLKRGKGDLLSYTNATAEGNTLRTSFLFLRVDENSGAITSLCYTNYNKSKIELVDTNSAIGLNSYHYLPGSDRKGLKQNGSVKISIKERGPLIASLLVESDAPGCNKLSREIRVHGMRNYVEIIDTVDKQAVRAKEGVHFGFAFNVPNATVRMDVPWGVVRPEIDQIPGACKNWFTVQHWVDISNEQYGVRWFTPDAPLVEIGGITANLIGSLSNPRAWMDHIEPSQTIYSWAMNNHWHTNYRAEQDGPTVFRYYIFPYIGKINSYSTGDRFAEECASPLVVTRARGESFKQLPFRLSNTKAQVTAFKPSEDGKAWIVRLFGSSNTDETVEFNWTGATPKTVSLSDTSEQPLKPVPATGKITVPASSIVTLRVEMDK